MKIRKATKKDSNALMKLLSKMESSDSINRAFIQNYMGKQNKCFFVAQKEEKIVGYILGHTEKRHGEDKGINLAKIEEIYVNKKFRGLNIGNLLLEKFYSWAIRKGSNKIRVYTKTTDKNAVSFWKNHKYKETWKMMEKRIK